MAITPQRSMATTRLDVCRVTVVTPEKWADVALPATEPLVDLLPALLDHVDEAELAGRPLTLQRLGHSPLDTGRSLTGNGILDGETLYLRPATEPLPEVAFDDAVSGIGAGVEQLPGRWTPARTRVTVLW